MQKLKDFWRWFNSRDGELFSAGLFLAFGISDLGNHHFLWASVNFILFGWCLYQADKLVGE